MRDISKKIIIDKYPGVTKALISQMAVSKFLEINFSKTVFLANSFNSLEALCLEMLKYL